MLCVTPLVICFLIWRQLFNYQKAMYVDNMTVRLPTICAWESEEPPGTGSWK